MRRTQKTARMASKKPAVKPGPPRSKSSPASRATKPTNETAGHTSSTLIAEPVVIPTRERENNPKGTDKTTRTQTPERVRLTYGAGLSSSTYDLTPDWDVHDIVEVIWVDAIANAITEWMDLEDLEDVQPCETLSVGYLLKDHPEWITIVGLLNEGSAGHAITIPRGMILAARVLGRP